MTASKRRLQDRLENLGNALKFALARSASVAGTVRLFYHAGLKPALVARGMARVRPERILRFDFAVGGAERWEVCVRENVLDLQTLREFFSPGTFWLEQFPKIEPRVIYDIGANIGVSSLFFATCYRRARIYGFEPLPANYEICRLNYRNLRGAAVFPWAVGAVSHRAVFEFNLNDNRGGRLAEVSSPEAPGAKERIVVEVFSVAELVEFKKLDPPEFLKIDVEGAELDVLQGIGGHLGSIQAMHIETHGPELRAGCRQWLERNGFSILGEREDRPGFGALWCQRA